MNGSSNFANQVSGPGSSNNRVWLYIIIGVIALCMVCVAGVGILGLIGVNVLPQLTQSDQPTAVVENNPAQEQSLTYIQEIILAKDVVGDTMDPVNPTTVFAPLDTIHAVVKIVNAPAGTRFKAIWLVEDVSDAAEPNTNIDEYELQVEGSRNLDFTLSPNSPWPAGRYRAEIYVNDNLAQAVYYTVSK